MKWRQNRLLAAAPRTTHPAAEPEPALPLLRSTFPQAPLLDDREAHDLRLATAVPALEDAVKLTVRHDDLVANSEMLSGISQGWPMILSNLKSVLETD